MPDRWVNFRIRDIYHPAPKELLDRLHGGDLLQGRIVDVVRSWEDPSRHGQRRTDYYALEVKQFPELVLIPAWKIVGDIRDDLIR